MSLPLVVSPDFKQQHEQLLRRLPHATLLSGDDGVGLLTIARDIAGDYSLLIQPTEATKTTLGSIGIETVRSLYEQTRGRTTDRQVIIIDDADRMSEPAQNAFLKLLEEPGQGIYFVLTSHHPERLLSTIRSRTAIVRVPHSTSAQSRQLLATLGIDAQAAQQALFIADGRPAELIRLAQSPRAREALITLMRDARNLIDGDRYTAYSTALQYAQSFAQAERLLHAVKRLLEHAIARGGDSRRIDQLQGVIDTHQRLQAAANPRLQLAQFVIQYL